MLNRRYIKSIKRDIFCFDFFSSILVSISFLLYWKGKIRRDIIVLISFLILFVSISFLVNIGKEMSLPGFRIPTLTVVYCRSIKTRNFVTCFCKSFKERRGF